VSEGRRKLRLRIIGKDRPLTLIFEFWATEFVLEPHQTVVVELDDPDLQHPPEVEHLPDGICFWSSGDHPTAWTPQGEEIEVF
jgi:hypothetical protein